MWNSLKSTAPPGRTAPRWAPASVTAWLLVVLVSSATTLRVALERRTGDPERGDVPGWVMVTLMTAGLVAVVWLLADEWLRALFQQAVDRVSGP